jgi:hypothetical protein
MPRRNLDLHRNHSFPEVAAVGAILACIGTLFNIGPAGLPAANPRFTWTLPQWRLELLVSDAFLVGASPFDGGLLVQTTKQISVFLENKPGRLANVLLALAREKVNVAALSVMDSHEHNVLRFVADDLNRSRQALKDLSIPFTESEVMQVELRNQPGELAHVCELLGAEHINIEYAYCSSGGRNGKTFGIFKVSNAVKAMRVLGASPNNSVRRRLEQRPLRERRSYNPPGARR